MVKTSRDGRSSGVALLEHNGNEPQIISLVIIVTIIFLSNEAT